MTVTVFKYLVVPVLIERDENDEVVREYQATDQPIAAYSRTQLNAVLDALDAEVAASNNGGVKRVEEPV